jgi:hypothetical protein
MWIDCCDILYESQHVHHIFDSGARAIWRTPLHAGFTAAPRSRASFISRKVIMPQYRSRTTTHGRNMAGARALWRATGMKDGDFDKPIIAVVNSFTQFVPGHVHLKDGPAGGARDRKAGGVAKDSTPSPSMTASPWATAACCTRCRRAT